MTFLKKFLADESGASAAEYALIIAIVGVGIGATALALGSNVTTAIGGASNDVAACGNGSADATIGTYVTDYTKVDCEN
jgi:pilus assembly protein Flp/PilA